MNEHEQCHLPELTTLLSGKESGKTQKRLMYFYRNPHISCIPVCVCKMMLIYYSISAFDISLVVKKKELGQQHGTNFEFNVPTSANTPLNPTSAPSPSPESLKSSRRLCVKVNCDSRSHPLFPQQPPRDKKLIYLTGLVDVWTWNQCSRTSIGPSWWEFKK